MKILLVNPPITKKQIYSRYSAGAPCLPPLGLCYLGAVLLKEGHEVRVMDCAVEDIGVPDVIRELESFGPRIVGITSTTVSYVAARGVLDAVKKTRPHVTTILGGAHISALPVEAMTDCAADIGVVGEGEETLLEIVRRLENNQSVDNVVGTLVRSNGEVVQNAGRPPIADLDSIPFPARQLLKDLRMYAHTPFRGARFTTTMITSRGCPFRCGYCDQSVFGRRWRAHTADYVLSEIRFLKETYGVEFISFEDDNFLLSRDRTVEICRKMIDAGFGIGWSCLGRANEVDDEVLTLMKKAGCRTVYMGVESGSSRLLDLMGKKLSIEDMEKGIRMVKRHGMTVTGSFILGLPTETKEEMNQTVKLALSLPLDGVTFFTFTPYPKTPLTDMARKHGWVSDDWRNYSGHPGTLPFVPAGMDTGYLLQVQATAYRKFLMRPQYLTRHIGMFMNRGTVTNAVRFLKDLITR